MSGKTKILILVILHWPLDFCRLMMMKMLWMRILSKLLSLTNKEGGNEVQVLDD